MSSNVRRVLTPIEYSVAFPNERVGEVHGAIEFRLRLLGRNETLTLCAQLNLLISDPYRPLQTLDQQMPLIRFLFDERVVDRIRRAAASLRGENMGWIAEPTAFHREQLLELIRLASIHCPDNAKYKSPMQNRRSKRAFVEAALLVSQLVLDKNYAHLDLDADADEVRTSTLEPMRHSARYASAATDPIRAFGRGKLIFFEHLPRVSSDFQRDFQQGTGLSLEDYYTCLFLVMASYLHVDPRRVTLVNHFVRIDEIFERLPHMKEPFQRYLGLESQTAAELQMAFQGARGSEASLKPLRQKPILRISDERAIVLDSAFYSEKAIVGPLFAVPQHTGKFLRDFGEAFEKYSQSILESIYAGYEESRRPILNENLSGAKGSEKGEIDACLIDNDQLLLFEIKAVWIREQAAVQGDFGEYLERMREYLEAARQLASVIKCFFEDICRIGNHDIRNTKRIYPVLVANDSSLNIPGFAWLFGKEFGKELKPDALLAGSNMIMKKGRWEVAPLAIMTVDVLEDLEVSARSFGLTALLRDYFSFRDSRFQGEADTLTLTEFIQLSDYKQEINTTQGTVVARALELFGDAKQRLLPNDPVPTSSACGQ